MTVEITDQQLGMILQVSREAALAMLAEAGGFMPFGLRVKLDGAIELVRLEAEPRDDLLQELYRRTQSMLADEARQGEILAAAAISNVFLDEDNGGNSEFERAVQVHVEAPAYSRVVLIPYRFPETMEVKQRRDVETGAMVPLAAPSAIFAA